jgi:hypothetical protein
MAEAAWVKGNAAVEAQHVWKEGKMYMKDALLKTAETFRSQAQMLAADIEGVQEDRDACWRLINMMKEALQLGAHTPEYLTAAITMELRRLEQRAFKQKWAEERE